MPLEASDILFVGNGASAVCWYRCALPATFLGADWVGATGSPPNLTIQTGLVGGETKPPDLYDYKAIVLQQPNGPEWLAAIEKLRARGVTVIYEVDDYLHGIHKLAGEHDFAAHFDARFLAGAEACMRASNAIIVSTDYLARRYAKFGPTHVCQNGIDLARYRLTRPPRPTVNIGWSGATGHKSAIEPWLPAVARVMGEHENTCFVTIGQPYAEAFARAGAGDRALSIPFTLVDQYPSAMTMFDVAIAPAGAKSFHRGKSDLRFLEAGALGIATVADPTLYPNVVDGVSGLLASTPMQAYEHLDFLVQHPDERERIGAAAKEYVERERDIRVLAPRWIEVLNHVCESGGT